MKKILIFCTLVFIVVLIAVYLELTYSLQTTMDSLVKVSESVEESKQHKSFVTNYQVSYISDSIVAYLNQHKLTYIDFMKLDFWIEKKYHFYHEYIYIRKYVYNDELRLLIEDPTNNVGLHPGYPHVGFKIKDSLEYSGDQGMGGKVCVLNIGKELKEKIELEVYIEDDSTTYIGNLMIEKDNYNHHK
ncbi:MAG TPA: hypothetical protein PLW09_12735 [Candidatus Kapabacteria bacterium]|nr:hypothetical protein [Candidatus Kapabacteria bacterium]